MSWMSEHSLLHRIADVPLVLCGPMLRRVEPTSVSVFVALKHARDVTLEVYEGLAQPRPLRMQGTARTLKLGEYLHVAVVTATLISDEEDPLAGGAIYPYNLRFAPIDGGTEQDLEDLGMLCDPVRLGFVAGDLPSFALPPNDLERLRLIHASCRKPHGESWDALEGLETMMKPPVLHDPLGRPHQLFLTGDQIYADDVSDSLLLMLMDAADVLLGWSELGIRRKLDGSFDRDGYTVTPTRLDGPAIPVNDIMPGHRPRVTRRHCGFTAHIGQESHPAADKSHLLCFGEYAAMYLFAWSPALWPDEADWPGFADIWPEFHPPGGASPEAVRRARGEILTELSAQAKFSSTLPKVRRALANIPSYMMFDDHEITDDWFLNREWCQDVLSSPLGPWVLQNGLAAFAVFQAWGNLPARFTPGLSGGELLKRLAEWSDLERRMAIGETGLDAGADAARNEVNERVGIGAEFLQQIQDHKRLPHPPAALEWHYRVHGPGYEVLVLDTRTWRAYPGGETAFAALISDQGLHAQISQPGEGQAEVTLVVSPAPVVGPPFVEGLQELVSITARKKLEKDAEAWGLQPLGFEHLLSTLARRLPRDNSLGKRRGRVLLLSGDVHYGFAARLQYWAVSPFAPGEPFDSPAVEECEMIAVQLTASSLKNEISLTRFSHGTGYTPTVNEVPKEARLGYNNQDGGRQSVGSGKLFGFRGNPGMIHLPPLFLAPSPPGLDLDVDPHWNYRIDYLLAENTAPAGTPRDFTPREVPVPPPDPESREERRAALAAYIPASANHADVLTKWGDGKEIVGVNNLGEISFVWNSQGERAAVQDLWWRLRVLPQADPPLPPFPLTTYVASLRYDDPSYPEVPERADS